MMARLSAALRGAASMLTISSATFVEFPIDAAYSYASERSADNQRAATTSDARAGATPRPDAAYRLVLAALSTEADQETKNAFAMSATIVGAASMYNPYRPGNMEGGLRTASGEPYDPNAWAAAIQTGLREKFRGVRYGKDYRPSYALVESADKQVIVKINDVGPLRPGRVIDFNEQTMRYFDPTLRRGVIHSVKVTPLLGDDWPVGPVDADS
jgi:rare lipoprotein A